LKDDNGACRKKYSRICQHGSQSRSNPGIAGSHSATARRTIGDVYMAAPFATSGGIHRHAAVEAVPPGVNYDLWTGPSPLKPFTRNRFHYNWHWIGTPGTVKSATRHP